MYIPPKSAGVVVAGSSQSLKIHFTEAEKSKKKISPTLWLLAKIYRFLSCLYEKTRGAEALCALDFLHAKCLAK